MKTLLASTRLADAWTFPLAGPNSREPLSRTHLPSLVVGIEPGYSSLSSSQTLASPLLSESHCIGSHSLFESFSGSDTSASGSKISRETILPILVFLRSKSQSIIFHYQTTKYTKALYFKLNETKMLNHANSRRLILFCGIFSCLTLL